MAFFRNPVAMRLGTPQGQLSLSPSPERSIYVQQLMARALQNNGRGSRSLAESLDIASAPIVGALLGRMQEKAQQQQMAKQTQIANQLLGQTLQKSIQLENLDGRAPDTVSVPSMSPVDPKRQALAQALAQNPQAMTQLAMQQAMPKPAPTMTPYEQAEIQLAQRRLANDEAKPKITPYEQGLLDQGKTRNDLERQRLEREAQPKPLTPPSGYQYGPDGKLSFIPGGPADPGNRPPNQGAQKDAELVDSVTNADNRIKQYEKEGITDTSSIKDAALGSTPITAVLQSEDYRKYKAAALQWTANLLYLKSGATANPGEVENNWKTYFPQPGDSKAVKEAKAAMREEELSNARDKFSTGAPGATPGASGGWKITPVP